MTQYKAVAAHALRLFTIALVAALTACAAAPTSTSVVVKPAVPAQPDTRASTGPSTGSSIMPVHGYAEAAAGAQGISLRNNAPLRYVVKKGDTLWGIANRYLADAWQWPELWYVNGKLKNPHKIYPGDVLELYNVKGRTMLARSDDLRLERLSPQVRESELGDSLPAIPIDAIRNFLKGPRVVDLETLSRAPYLLAFAGEHIIGGANMGVFIKNLPADAVTVFATVRQGMQYKDPDTGELLGYEAIPSGEVEIKALGNPAEGMLTKSVREILPGDRLLPPEAESYQANFYPHVPTQAVDGKIISVYQGVSEISQYQIVAMNRGSKHGLEPGHVLRVLQLPREVKDPITGKQELLPEQSAGLLMVFKTMPGISYGLIMDTDRPIHVLDRVEKPLPGSIRR